MLLHTCSLSSSYVEDILHIQMLPSSVIDACLAYSMPRRLSRSFSNWTIRRNTGLDQIYHHRICWRLYFSNFPGFGPERFEGGSDVGSILYPNLATGRLLHSIRQWFPWKQLSNDLAGYKRNMNPRKAKQGLLFFFPHSTARLDSCSRAAWIFVVSNAVLSLSTCPYLFTPSHF
ncbi:hypothetical protein GALMADRAFT_334980 [Galerina marginata CBS 339.88]|uniref:Uncharacterized protein n=1 Tax=Galerina marginata (strain CBS 339.88) TaxID=685588 RepID=A0A067TSB9_GALM3|nr:hypothetical protein GALMADRAFT_334980 [Galerina marginata CBS 339.88]